MFSFYAAKGGVGCSVVAAASSLLAARTRPTVLVDLVGDQAAVLGVDADGPGLANWFEAESALPDALSRLEVPVCDELSLLPFGTAADRLHGGLPSDHLDTLARLLQIDGREVVVDVGTRSREAASVLGVSNRAVLVTRACYLAVRAARSLAPPDEVVLIEEPGRPLRRSDLANDFGVAIDVVLRWDPAVARIVDAGLLAGRLPRSLLGLRGLL